VTKLWAEQLRNCGSIASRGNKYLSDYKNIQIASETHIAASQCIQFVPVDPLGLVQVATSRIFKQSEQKMVRLPTLLTNLLS